MKKYLLLQLSALLIPSSYAFAADPKEFTLKPAGKIVILNEKETYSKNCRSTRSWPEISGLKSRTVQDKLNQKFKRILSVGRKLKASDCLPPDSNEDYTYSNEALIGAQKGDYIGVNFYIVFPGGSTRALRDCRVFDLTSGNEIHLKKFLNANAFKNGQQILKEGLPDQRISEEFEPEGLNTNLEQKFSSLCLEKDGLRLYKNFDAKWGGVLLKEADRDKIFKPSPVIDTIMAL